MKFAQSIQINVTSDKVFEVYQNVKQWSEWNSGIEFSSISGPFKTGTKGELKHLTGPINKIFFNEVTHNKSFTTVRKLPLCMMYCEHKLSSNENGTNVTHKVRFKGILAPLFGRLIGKNIKQDLPTVMNSLKKHLEKTVSQ